MALELAAIYADGWDKAVVNPMTREEAKACDAAGAPYAVLLLDGTRLHTLLQVSWRNDYCHMSQFDALGRRTATHDLRRTADGDLFLYEKHTWDGPDDVSEFEFVHVAARHSTRYHLDGSRFDIDEPRGDRGTSTHTQTSEHPPRLPTPQFGQWHDLLEFAGYGRPDITDAVTHELPVVLADRPPWRPPQPLMPVNIDKLFVPGSTRTAGGRPMRIELHQAGQLRMPSGRLVVADPSSLDFDAGPYTATVTAGTYPVTVSLARFVDDPGHTRVAAARLEITRRPVARWEMALRDGQELLALGHREFWGFGVDAGMACFVDADECQRLVDRWKDFDGIVDERFLVVESGAMVAWLSGWGDGAYPTWIGRDANGDVVCFVADMLLFDSPDDEDQ